MVLYQQTLMFIQIYLLIRIFLAYGLVLQEPQVMEVIFIIIQVMSV